MEPDDERRRRLGAWYTPTDLVGHVVARTVPARLTGPVTILDPACGDGRFLVEASRVARDRGGEPVLIGVDIDEAAIAAARRHPELADAELVCADALDEAASWRRHTVDVVVGNPPFLSPLSSAVRADDRRRGGASGRGAYTDVAVRFLDLMVRHVRPVGGRVGLVLPISVLGSRDAAAVRRAIAATCDMQWFWWSPDPLFDASVTTCAVTLERVASPTARPVARSLGADMRPIASAPRPTESDEDWGALIADQLGVPTAGLDALSASSRLGDHAEISADFRDQYYGLLDALVEIDSTGAPFPGVLPLVTTAHIDPALCHWGRRRVRYGKRQWWRPGVDRALVDADTASWIERRAVPKVVVATQTAVIEAVADHDGCWLPAVPAISVVPTSESRITLDEIVAVLTSPVPSALVACRAAGTGLSPRVVRVTARHLARLPWPDGPLDDAVAACRAGRLQECAELVSAAYGITGRTRDDLVDWWVERLPQRSASPGSIG